jgi:5-methylthioribose kinase
MTAAPAAHRTWKELLLAGELESGEAIARACGELLAALHGATWREPKVAAQFDDRTFFDQLRLDPYYRQIARVHPQLAPPVGELIDSVRNHRRSLVHGDFSPKNLLVWPGHLMLIDFEVGHYGDPAFDLGFFLTHLVLKSIRAAPAGERYLSLANSFWNAYREALVPQVGGPEMADLEQRAMLNLAGCLLARIDGKSPVDYLNPQQQAVVRGLASGWLVQPPAGWNDAHAAICQITGIMPP